MVRQRARNRCREYDQAAPRRITLCGSQRSMRASAAGGRDHRAITTSAVTTATSPCRARMVTRRRLVSRERARCCPTRRAPDLDAGREEQAAQPVHPPARVPARRRETKSADRPGYKRGINTESC